MVQLEILRQNTYSRVLLLLRTLFGVIYIILPHFLVLLVLIIGMKILWIYSVFVILITGKIPKKVFNYQLGVLNWLVRLHAAVYNLTDEYPRFGLQVMSESAGVQIPLLEESNRLTVLMRFVLAPVIYIPHLLVLPFLSLFSAILMIGAFFSVLVTFSYPEKLFNFQISYLKWILNIAAYLLNLSDTFPSIFLPSAPKVQ
jgi:hypothetical protein